MGNPVCQDWVRLEVLILRRACAILRKLFNKRWRLSQKTEWLNNSQFGKDFISGIGANFYEHAGRLQRLTLEEGDVNNWDFTMLAKILQTVNFPNISNIEIAEENEKIDELVTIRNKASQYPIKSMQDKEFSDYWDTIEHILVSFGESEKELEELKLSPSISEEHLLLLSTEEHEPVNDNNTAQAMMLKEESKILLNRGKIEAAIESLTKAVGLPGVPDIELGILYASRSEAFLKSSSTKKDAKDENKRTELIYLALKDAKKALSLRPMWGLAHYRVGTAYVELKKFKKACKYLDQAVEREPNLQEIQTARKNCGIRLVKSESQENYDFDPSTITFGSVGDKVDGINHGGTIISPGIRECMERIFFATTEEENPLACIWRAHLLRDGQDVKQNLRQAAILYRKGVSSRNAEGMYNLALLKIEGRGVRQDFPGAIKLLKKAASQPHKISNGSLCVSNIGVSDAEFVLGYLHSEGIGVAQRDYFIAGVWYLSSSDHGHGPAANNLAVLTYKGLGVMRSSEKSLQLWKLAACRKVPHAMHALAIHHLKEWELPEARKWFQQAIRASSYETPESFLTEEEKTQFEKALEQIRLWKNQFQHKEVSKYENAKGLCGKNTCMKDRIIRMLKEVDSTKIQSHEDSLNSLTPKSVRITFDNVKSSIVHKTMLSNGTSNGNSINDETQIISNGIGNGVSNGVSNGVDHIANGHTELNGSV